MLAIWSRSHPSPMPSGSPRRPRRPTYRSRRGRPRQSPRRDRRAGPGAVSPIRFAWISVAKPTAARPSAARAPDGADGQSQPDAAAPRHRVRARRRHGEPELRRERVPRGGLLVRADRVAAGPLLRAHFHPGDLSTGFEGQHYGHTHELHGIYIRALDGKPFRLESLRYRLTRNRQIPRNPSSIQGFSNFNVQVLIGTSFDPRLSIRSQFEGFPVGMAVAVTGRCRGRP